MSAPACRAATLAAATAIAVWCGAGVAAAQSPTKVTVAAAPVPRAHRSHPRPFSLSFGLTVGTDSAGHPARPVRTAMTAMPRAVRDDLRDFATCRAAVVHNDHSSKPPRCPRRSRLGAGSATVFIAAFSFQTSTDRGVIIRTGRRRVVFWWHEPTYGLTGTVDGVLIPARRGPTIRWDFSPYSQGRFTGDNPVSVVRFATRFGRRGRRVTPFEAAACRSGSWLFSTTLVFADGSSQVIHTALPCGRRAPRRARTTEGSGSAPLSPPGCGSPLCLPLASGISSRRALTGRRGS